MTLRDSFREVAARYDSRKFLYEDRQNMGADANFMQLAALMLAMRQLIDKYTFCKNNQEKNTIGKLLWVVGTKDIPHALGFVNDAQKEAASYIIAPLLNHKATS